VDNGSTDGSPEFVARRFPQVRIIRHDENLGFVAGNNTAIRATRSPYVVTLNNQRRTSKGHRSTAMHIEIDQSGKTGWNERRVRDQVRRKSKERNL